MKKVFTREELIWVVQAKYLLETQGIECFLRNEYASSVAGEVPFTHTWPELWVRHDHDVESATKLIKQWQQTMQDAADYPAWQCQQCGETNEGHFALCWSCGLVLQPAN